MVSLSKDSSKYHLLLKNGEKIIADRVVLAMGNYPPPHLPLKEKSFLKSSRYIKDPWAQQNLFPSSANILIVGSGLTMVDQVLELHSRNHQGNIHVISRHGFIPLSRQDDVHCSYHPSLELFQRLPPKFVSIRRALFNEMRKAQASGIDLDCILDPLREFLVKRALSLSLAEQRSIARRFKAHLGVFYHRMPEESNNTVQELIKTHQLQVMAGSLNSIVEKGEELEVQFRLRKNEESRNIRVDYVINCLGPAARLEDIRDPFLNQLFEMGLIRSAVDQMVLHSSTDLRVINKNGEEHGVFALGSLKKKILGPAASAVPDISLEVQKLSYHLVMGNISQGRKDWFN